MPSESMTVKVAGRVRPLTETENSKGSKRIVRTQGNSITIDASNKEQSFSLDYAYGSDVSPSEIYSGSCDGFLQRALNGYNVTIMAFGAAGAGKTHVMSGSEEEPGIIPCLIKDLFKHIGANKNKEYFVTASFVEIFDETVTDMLNPHTNQMVIREHPQLGIYLDGLSDLVSQSEDDLARLYDQGQRARKMGAGDVRAHRAKSTGIFTITVDQRDNAAAKVGMKATIQLADLAGFEMDEEGSDVAGDKSVNAVCNVLTALKKGGHVPYRESQVTRLLQDALGGNSATLMLACVSPADKCYSETVATLQFAQGAKSIKNKVKMNLDETQSLISDLRDEIAKLRTKIMKTPEDTESVVKMEELIKDLDVAKKQTWEEKERLSGRYEEERKTNLANKGMLEWVMDTAKRGNKEVQERIVILQKEKDHLTLEYRNKRKMVDDMKDNLQKKIQEYSKLAESKKGGSESETKSHVASIHELKEKLKRESDNLKDIKRRLKDLQDRQRTEKDAAQGMTAVKGNAELRQMVEAEERKRQEADNKALVAEQLERSKLDVQHEKAEIQMRVKQGKQYSVEESVALEMSLADAKADMSVMSLQMQCLQQEKEKLQKDMEQVYKLQKDELQIQQLQHFQTFRQYRELFEQQKAVLEQRYRGLLEDAIQDAVFLSSRNNELMQENQALQHEMNAMKDKITALEGKVGKR